MQSNKRRLEEFDEPVQKKARTKKLLIPPKFFEHRGRAYVNDVVHTPYKSIKQMHKIFKALKYLEVGICRSHDFEYELKNDGDIDIFINESQKKHIARIRSAKIQITCEEFREELAKKSPQKIIKYLKALKCMDIATTPTTPTTINHRSFYEDDEDRLLTPRVLKILEESLFIKNPGRQFECLNYPPMCLAIPRKFIESNDNIFEFDYDDVLEFFESDYDYVLEYSIGSAQYQRAAILDYVKFLNLYYEDPKNHNNIEEVEAFGNLLDFAMTNVYAASYGTLLFSAEVIPMLACINLPKYIYLVILNNYRYQDSYDDEYGDGSNIELREFDFMDDFLKELVKTCKRVYKFNSQESKMLNNIIDNLIEEHYPNHVIGDEGCS